MKSKKLTPSLPLEREKIHALERKDCCSRHSRGKRELALAIGSDAVKKTETRGKLKPRDAREPDTIPKKVYSCAAQATQVWGRRLISH